MMKFELTLRYLAEKSGIPVWVLGESGLLACGVKQEYLADESVRARFLAEVASGCTEGVQVRKLSSGELYACFSAEDGVYIAGPSYELHPLIGGKRGSAGILFAPANVKAALLMMPAVSAAEFCRFVSVLSEVVRGVSFDPAALEGEICTWRLADSLDMQLTEALFDIREEEDTYTVNLIIPTLHA